MRLAGCSSSDYGEVLLRFLQSGGGEMFWVSSFRLTMFRPSEPELYTVGFCWDQRGSLHTRALANTRYSGLRGLI